MVLIQKFRTLEKSITIMSQYRIDLSRLLIDNPEYYLVEKHNYTINEIAFSPDI